MLYRAHCSRCKGLVNAGTILHPETREVLLLPWEILSVAKMARLIDAGIDYIWFNPHLTF